MTDCSLGDLVGEVTNRMSLASEVRGITLEVQVGEDLPSIAIDSSLITRVLENVIGNGIKHSPEDSVITVVLDDAGPE